MDDAIGWNRVSQTQEDNAEPSAWGAFDPRPSALILANGHSNALISKALVQGGARLLEGAAGDEAMDRLDRVVALDLLVADCRDGGIAVDALFARLNGMADADGTRVLAAVSGVQLDAAFALLTAPGVSLLCDPDDTEWAVALGVALAQVRHPVAPSLNDIGRESEAMRLHRLSEEVSRIARTLASLSAGVESDNQAGINERRREYAPPPESFSRAADDISAHEVREMLRLRRLRDRYLGVDLFADPAWDILLDLLGARLAGDRVSVSSLCIAAAVPATTALRWIKTLTDQGLLLRQADPHDGRRVFIALSDSATEAMLRYFRAVRSADMRLI